MSYGRSMRRWMVCGLGVIRRSFVCIVAVGLMSCTGRGPAGREGVYPQIESDWQMPLKERRRPDTHTVAFRTLHGSVASAKDAKCGQCHVGLSGSPLNSCLECHATARPRDHTVRFRGTAHGRASAANPERCSVCHEADVCTTCHNIAPPSHSPLRVFRGRHGRAAARNPRSCHVCHSFETSCVECHALDVAPPSR